ncbi:hypothetical protein BJY04DRAFT_184476, partial [Aspergillus karnatakaensis]|uniref:FAD-dependent oxidoreductase n=1 Tax=Aspergillus karnatakaensis TaxID=1810916 RepID=UPI003CCDC488
MWRAANLSHPNLVTEKETRTMCAEYSCAVGISFPVKGLECPDQVMCCHDDQAVLLFPGKDGSIRWVLIQKLRKRYVYPETHRFSKDEVHAMCQAAADIPVYRGIKFKDIWTRTTEYGSALLQEGLLQIWTHGRTVCIGDSVSKITPNIAQGANTTIESAAALANVLRQVRDLQQPSEQTIGRLLQGYAEKHRKRLQGVHALSYRATRLCAWSGVRWKLMARYVWPNVPGGLYHAFVKIIAPGPVLDFIPLPSRCMQEGVMLSGLSTMRFGWVVLMIIAGVAAMSFSL